jgi:diguanylate cyclase (GGDEF)-like protein/PAS domain S-box-containing protein
MTQSVNINMLLLKWLIPLTTKLHIKLMLSLAILVSLSVMSVAYFVIEHERDIRLAQLERRADRLTNLISRSVAYSVWNVDFVAIDEQVASLSSDPEVAQLTITATGYGVLRNVVKSDVPLIDPIKRVSAIDFAAPGADPQQIGEVSLTMTRALVAEAIGAAHRAVFFLVATILMVLCVATYLLIRHMVSAPVTRLKIMVDKIAEGDLDAHGAVESRDEIGQLALRVNTMAHRLRESDRHLRDSQENLAITLDSIGDGVIATDEKGNITRMNPTAERLTGWTQNSALGLPLAEVFQIINAETREPSINPVQQVFERGTIVGLANHTILLARNGDEYQIADSAAPIRKADGSIVGVVLVFSDVSAQYRTTIELATAKAHLQATLDAIPDLLFEVDSDGVVLRYHAHRTNLLAAPPEFFLGKSFNDVLPADAAEICMKALREAAKKGWSAGASYSLMLAQGETWFELSVAAMPGLNGQPQHFTVITRDITERKQAEVKLQLAANVFVNAGEGIIITDAKGIILDVNQSFSDITGYSQKEAVGQKTSILKSDRHPKSFYQAIWNDLFDHGRWSGEIWNRRKNGEIYVELLTINAVRDSQFNPLQYVAIFSDITAVKEHQRQLEYIAHFDALTNLPNRVLLAERLLEAMAKAKCQGKQLAVAFLDLDGFKEINDRHSHQMGDKVLVDLTQRMTHTLRSGDTLARIGGDEFVAVLNDLNDPSDSLPLLTRLLTAAALPMQIGTLSLQVSASIGVTYYPQSDNIDADQLLRQADQAMYQAKVAGKNRYHIFDEAQDNNLRWYHESLERIRLALDQNEFVLYYQPKVNLRTGQVIGAEALIRWQHPEKGLLLPAAFLPTIEDHPLAVTVGEWVIDNALAQLETWSRVGLDLPQVSVNVGARQLQQSDFVERLKIVMSNHPNVEPNRLQIEVLETSALADMVVVSQAIEKCAHIGVEFALDDFGTGYSSLTYLKRLNVAMLKIDQSFVRDMLEDPDDLAILQGVIGLAAAFKRQVIAEGVETLEHGTALLELGCELAQGYGVARPMPGEDLAQWIDDWQFNDAWHDLQAKKMSIKAIPSLLI